MEVINFVVFPDKTEQLNQYLKAGNCSSILVIKNELVYPDDALLSYLKQLKENQVNVYVDIHNVDASCPQKIIDIELLVKDMVNLGIDGFVVSDMDLETLNVVKSLAGEERKIFFECKVESEIYRVYREKSNLKAKYRHIDIDDKDNWRNLIDKVEGIRVLKPSIIGLGLLQIFNTQVIEAVFVSTGEYHMFMALKKEKGIDYFGEWTRMLSMCGCEYIFIPMDFQDDFRWPIWKKHDSEVLERIVNDINNNLGSLIFEIDEGYIKWQDGCGDETLYCCPGNICKHSKINVMKLYEKLKKLGLNSTVRINGCREGCIHKNTEIDIVCTLGGPIVHFNSLNENVLSEAKIISNVFEDELNRREK